MLIWSFHLFYFVCRWVGGGCCLGLQSLYVLSTQSTMCMHVVRQGNKVLSLSLQVTTKYIILAIFPLMDDFSLSGKDHFTLFQKHNMQTLLCFLMFQIFRSDISNPISFLPLWNCQTGLSFQLCPYSLFFFHTTSY